MNEEAAHRSGHLQLECSRSVGESSLATVAIREWAKPGADYGSPRMQARSASPTSSPAATNASSTSMTSVSFREVQWLII